MTCDDVDAGGTRHLCDGCREIREVEVVTDYSYDARYCAECRDIYLAWAVAMKQDEARRQREFDLYMLETRQSLPLKFMPIDLPPRKGLDGLRLA